MSPSSANRPASAIRPAAVAGRFYPDDPIELRQQIQEFLAAAPDPVGPAPKAIIAPHAGYLYSGPIAAVAYKQLLPRRDVIRRVVLIGPAHYAAFPGLALSSADGFATPLGVVPVDPAARQLVHQIPELTFRDEAHAPEHALEVHLPFLQVVLRQFTVVPLLVGDSSVEQVGRVLDVVWGGSETCLVISSDLSHYLDSQTARKTDEATARAIVSLDAARIGERQACGCVPIGGLLEAARRHQLLARALDLRNSGDTAGPKDRVVGYGAFAFEPAAGVA